jgi:hypothetical protein
MMISFPVLRVRHRPRLGGRRGWLLGERSDFLEAPTLGVAAGVLDPAMIPLSNTALIPLVGVHRNLKHSEELTLDREEQWTQVVLRCVLVATFLIISCDYLFGYKEVAGNDPTFAP